MSNAKTNLANWTSDKLDKLKSKLDRFEDNYFDKNNYNYDEMVNEVERKYHKTKENAKKYLDDVISSLEDHSTKLPSYIRSAGDSVKSFSDDAADKTEELINSCGQINENVKSELTHDLDKVIKYVKNNPGKSLLYAVVGGLIISRFF